MMQDEQTHACDMRGTLSASGNRFGKLAASLLTCGVALVCTPALATNFSLFGIDGDFNLTGSYAYAVRIENPSPQVIDAPGRPEVPIPEAFKYPESNNFDDGDRNFKQWEAVNNRVTALSQLQLNFTDNFGIKVSGDAFYDRAYKTSNHNTANDRLNYFPKNNEFNSATRYFNGARARLLDAYAFGTFYFGNNASLDIKIGRHVTAWGQSLFFSGVALAQSPADATKATVPGADVKSILLPTNQISARLKLNSKITLLGQWKLRYKHTELNPDGGFFSPADIVGPGAEFAYGIKNPLNLTTLSDIDLTDTQQLGDIGDLLDQLLLGAQAGGGPLGNIIGGLLQGPLGDIVNGLPPVSLPDLGNPLNATNGINVQRGPDISPDKHDTGQWGAGIEYALNYTTSIGYYHLNYHDTNPSPVQNFAFATLIPAQGLIPEITTQAINQKVPVTYNIKYFEDIKLDAVSFSTVAFGANFGGEFIYRNGAPVLVDVDSGLTGPVPTPTRSKTYQVLLNGISVYGPALFWDSLTLVGSIGYTYIGDIQAQPALAGPNVGQPYNQLTFDRNSAAFTGLITFGKRAVFPGWDLQVPISFGGAVYNRSALAGAYGSLLGQDDYRLGVSVNFTRLQKLTLGLTYNGFIGSPKFDGRPLQDRDTLAVTAKYNFF